MDGDRRAGLALHDDHVADRRGTVERLVGHLLERHDLPAPVAAVGGDERDALRVVDAIAQRFRAEAAEHDAVDRANPRARQHRDGELWNQRHVERDAIAARHAERLENVGKRVDLAVEIPVGERAAIAGSPSQMNAALLRRGPRM